MSKSFARTHSNLAHRHPSVQLPVEPVTRHNQFVSSLEYFLTVLIAHAKHAGVDRGVERVELGLELGGSERHLDSQYTIDV